MVGVSSVYISHDTDWKLVPLWNPLIIMQPGAGLQKSFRLESESLLRWVVAIWKKSNIARSCPLSSEKPWSKSISTRVAELCENDFMGGSRIVHLIVL